MPLKEPNLDPLKCPSRDECTSHGRHEDILLSNRRTDSGCGRQTGGIRTSRRAVQEAATDKNARNLGTCRVGRRSVHGFLGLGEGSGLRKGSGGSRPVVGGCSPSVPRCGCRCQNSPSPHLQQETCGLRILPASVTAGQVLLFELVTRAGGRRQACGRPAPAASRVGRGRPCPSSWAPVLSAPFPPYLRA